MHESQRYSLTKISANHPSVARGLVRWHFVALKFAVAERPFIGQRSHSRSVDFDLMNDCLHHTTALREHGFLATQGAALCQWRSYDLFRFEP